MTMQKIVIDNSDLKETRGRPKSDITVVLETLEIGEGFEFKLDPKSNKVFERSRKAYMAHVSSLRASAKIKIKLGSTEISKDEDAYVRIWRRA